MKAKALQRIRLALLAAYSVLLIIATPKIALADEPGTGGGAQTSLDNPTKVGSKDQLEAAIRDIDASGKPGFIALTADLTDQDVNVDITGDVTILGEGHTIHHNGSTMFRVTNKGRLGLGAPGYTKTLTIQGNAGDIVTDCLLAVSGSGVLDMYDGVMLKDQTCKGTAGAVDLSGSAKFNLHGGTISSCKGSITGGVMVSDGTSFIMSGGAIENCDIEEDQSYTGTGTAAYIQNATFSMTGGTISGCTGSTYGGAVCTIGSTVSISGGSIINNQATQYGGALFAQRSSVSISGGTISSNSAKYGGGIILDGGTATLSGATIENNTATAVGGGLYAEGVAIKGASDGQSSPLTIQHNQANTAAGGVLLNGTSVSADFSSAIIANNYASEEASDICLNGGASATLPDAAGMKQIYEARGINDDSKAGKAIDGWYEDPNDDGERYIPKRNAKSYDTSGDIKADAGQSISLVASYRERIPVVITVSGENQTYTYDGAEHTARLTYGYLVDGKQVDALPRGLEVKATAADVARGTDAGTYATKIGESSFAVSGTSASDYDVAFKIGRQASLTIEPRNITLTSGSASKAYDGKALTCHKMAQAAHGADKGFVKGEGATYTYTGSQTKVGSSENSFEYTLNSNTKAANYQISKSYGKLTVTAVKTPDSADKNGESTKIIRTAKTLPQTSDAVPEVVPAALLGILVLVAGLGLHRRRQS